MDTKNDDPLDVDADDGMNALPDSDRQIVTDSDAIDEGQNNDSDLGADVAGDIGPKHD